MKAFPKIVVANDEDWLLGVITLLLRDCLNDAEILAFQNSKTAWRVLSGLDPDLLITDDKMPNLSGQDICQRLLARKVCYPIIVNSGWPLTEQWVREKATLGLNVRFLRCPFKPREFREALEGSLTSFGSDAFKGNKAR